MAKNDAMNKSEKPLLIILSLISLGLLIAIIYVWYNALSNRSQNPPNQGILTPPQNEQSQSQSTPSAGTPESTGVVLNINTPQMQDVVASPTLTIEGTTGPKASVALSDASDETIATADVSGAFSATLALDMGENQITVTAFDSKGQSKSEVLNVVYMP
ncbi:MAG: hypothetical protein M1352_02070 [Patescibacteria group bacterium]|nr:hypothetical protein [Patescibacteria group bacterium]